MKYGVLVDNFTKDDINCSILRDFYQYWLDMKGDKLIPSRADLNPTDIPHLLPYMMLIDVEYQPRRYRYRLVGTETVRAMGEDVTGKYLDERPRIEKHVKKRSDWIVKNKRPYLYLDKLKWSGRSLLDYQTVAMPLSSNDVDINILMLGMYYHIPNDQRTEEYPTRSR